MTRRSRHNAVTRSLRSAEVRDVLEQIIGDKLKADFMTVSPSMYASPRTPMITSSDLIIFYIKNICYKNGQEVKSVKFLNLYHKTLMSPVYLVFHTKVM